MIIAMACDDGLVSNHFGHCKGYLFYHVIENSTILSRKYITSPEHRPGYLPLFIKNLGADLIISGGMGITAQELFAESGIKTLIGVQGKCDDVIARYLNNTIVTNPDTNDQCFSKIK